jgi:molybdopterin-dependent oxidoreductase alpha subunit
MAKPRVRAAGGIPAILYVFRKGREAGGFLRLFRRLRSKNACKTCALGMGGQRGGMVNEAGHFPEVCKKSVQAQAADMVGAITKDTLRAHPVDRLARLSSAEFERLGRVTFPMLLEEGDTHFRRISWDESFERVAAALKDAPPDETFFYASGRSSNEAAFLLQLVARAYGTANIHNCSYYCHAASGVALADVYGSGTSSVLLDDLDRADFALVAGANPASNHPRLVTQLMKLRRRGGTVVVVNPLKELGLTRFRIPSDVRSMLFGSTISDLYVQPHIGGDVAFFRAVLRRLVERGALDDAFLANHTSGWDAVRDDLLADDPAALATASGVSIDVVERTVDLVASAKRGIFLWAMGLTHHENGVDNIRALANVALARGWLGRPGTGLLPIRGHSNVQGVGSVGVSPALKESFAQKLEETYDIRVPRDPGQDTYASMVAAADGRIRASLLLGGNLFASNPDRSWAADALRRIPFTVSLTTKLNEGHVHGRGRTMLILPVLARDEESQSTTQESMFNLVRLSDGGTPSVAGEMRSEVEIIATIADRVLPKGRVDWSAFRSHHALRDAIARVVPGYEAIADIDRGEFQIAGRTFHEPRFPTPDGRAHFHVTPLPPAWPVDTFRLMTIRSEGQFNTVVYEEEDLYRGNTRRDVVMMAQRDADALDLREGDPVTVVTETGELDVVAAIVDLPPGNLAMYYPEANALVPRKLDPRSKTPAFKSVAATLRTRVAAVR